MTKKNLIQKSDNEIGKFLNRKKGTYKRTGTMYCPVCIPDEACIRNADDFSCF